MTDLRLYVLAPDFHAARTVLDVDDSIDPRHSALRFFRSMEGLIGLRPNAPVRIIDPYNLLPRRDRDLYRSFVNSGRFRDWNGEDRQAVRQ